MAKRATGPIRRHAEAAAAAGVYAILFVAWDVAGGSFRVWPDLWQLLPWPPLLQDLGGALLDLHAQPPWLNLVFGLALQASAATGVAVERLLEPVYFAAGAASVAALAEVAARLVPRAWARRAALGLLLLNPYLYAAFHYLFYTAWEVLFLSLGALLAMRHLERPSASRLAAALAPAVLLVYARSLFHPVWFAVVLAVLLVLGRGAAPAGRLGLAAVSAVAVLLVAAWPAKNLARFGFFGFSSWSGMSIARGLPTGEPLLPSGYPARLAAFARTSDAPLDPAAAAAAQRLVPPELRARPALAAVAKPDGSPNWNHYAIIPLSRELGEAARARLLAEPSLLAAKAADFYLNGYAVYEARWPYAGGLSPEMTVGAGWAAAYEAVVFQRFRGYEGGRTLWTTGFAVVFPLLLAAALAVLWRRRGAWGPRERLVVLMLLSVVWVLALVLLVDGPEGNRVRFSTEPYLLLVAAWVAGGRTRDPGAGPGT